MAIALAGVLGVAPRAHARPYYPGEFTEQSALDQLREKVGARAAPIESPETLANLYKKLEAARAGKGRVRILQLGDSHIASDYITGRIRQRLQLAYGDAGRGFVHAGQRWGYGGRRIKKFRSKDWDVDRIVDAGRAGRPFGFSGYSLGSLRPNVSLAYRVESDERTVRLYLYQHAQGGELEARLDGVPIGQRSLKGPSKSVVWTLDVGAVPPSPETRPKLKHAKDARVLEVVARSPQVRVFGLSFEREAPGVIYESIGPVGADAKVYLQLGRTSFQEHLSAHAPDAVVLMVGGNDALKVRKGWTDLDRVRKDHEAVVSVLRQILPGVAVLIWAPMDAGRRQGRRIVSRALLPEVRDLQRAVAQEAGCAFWDVLGAMGGPGGIGAWSRAKVMNKDLVHPKKPAADLLGDLFATAFLAAAPPR